MSKSNVLTLYIFGTTCVGKDTLMEYAQKIYPDQIGLVQVGKEFTNRYPPERFAGQGAMADTEEEAFEIFQMQHDAAVAAGKSLVLVSAQPRLPGQVERVCGYAPGHLVWLMASEDTLLERVMLRHPNDPGKTELRLKRLTNDKVILFDTLWHVLKKGMSVLPLSTDGKEPQELLTELLRWYLPHTPEWQRHLSPTPSQEKP